MDFPITPEAVGTLVGAAFMAGILTQWLKKYLGDWRWTQLLVLVLSIALQLGATVYSRRFDWWGACMWGFLGASITAFGYEAIANLLGIFGAGSRAVK